ncbi:MAG: hypothetical protein EP318_06270 [Rhodobacteraceae bacterium]|nr:MAG: hypothetical protein EP318_06270 [Paracoccaceae bacterium]
MVDFDAVIARLQSQVPDLRSVQGAGAYKALVEGNTTPQQDPAAYVIPLGLRGSTPEAVAGLFRQPIAESIGVVLFIRGHDAHGAKALADVRPFIDTVIGAIAGWQSSDELGVFQLSRGALIGISSGLLSYQIDFAINDQLRIAT